LGNRRAGRHGEEPHVGEALAHRLADERTEAVDDQHLEVRLVAQPLDGLEAPHEVVQAVHGGNHDGELGRRHRVSTRGVASPSTIGRPWRSRYSRRSTRCPARIPGGSVSGAIAASLMLRAPARFAPAMSVRYWSPTITTPKRSTSSRFAAARTSSPSGFRSGTPPPATTSATRSAGHESRPCRSSRIATSPATRKPLSTGISGKIVPRSR